MLYARARSDSSHVHGRETRAIRGSSCASSWASARARLAIPSYNTCSLFRKAYHAGGGGGNRNRARCVNIRFSSSRCCVAAMTFGKSRTAARVGKYKYLLSARARAGFCSASELPTLSFSRARGRLLYARERGRVSHQAGIIITYTRRESAREEKRY